MLTADAYQYMRMLRKFRVSNSLIPNIIWRNLQVNQRVTFRSRGVSDQNEAQGRSDVQGPENGLSTTRNEIESRPGSGSPLCVACSLSIAITTMPLLTLASVPVSEHRPVQPVESSWVLQEIFHSSLVSFPAVIYSLEVVWWNRRSMK